MIQNNSLKSPIDKIWLLLNYFKSFQSNPTPYSYQVQHTRKQIAHLTGLTIETVIRSVKALESEQQLQIIKGKIFI